jgi:hypothetical protein
MRFSSNSVVCDERPSEAKQGTAGGEEKIRAVFNHTLRWYDVRSPHFEGQTGQG